MTTAPDLHRQVEAVADRELTDSEVSFYQENGWVFLPQLVSPSVVTEMLRHLKQVMGMPDDESRDGDEAAFDRGRTGGRSFHHKHHGFSDYNFAAEEDSYLASITYSHEAGRNAQRLMGRNCPVRLWRDSVAVKYPHSSEAASGKVNWHQDANEYPLDRNGSMIFWLALVDMVPEMGTMRFLSRSHCVGGIGFKFYDAEDPDYVFQQYPLLRRCAVSEPLSYRAGDATVHSGLTCHFSGLNMTDRPRWAYQRGYIPGDALYTGEDFKLTRELGLEVGKELDHPKFPVVCPAATDGGSGSL
jgi:Phytanoyl-CoA dioxygenase (PhyH)